MSDFIKTSDHQGGISSPFGCRASALGLEEGFAHCIKCSKRHLVITDCEGADFVCGKCKGEKQDLKWSGTIQKPLQYLVIIENKNLPIEFPFADKYRVYNDFQEAMKWAVKHGFENPFGMGVNISTGQLNTYACGDIKVGVMAVEAK